MMTNKTVSALAILGLSAAVVVGCSVKDGKVMKKPPVVEPLAVSYGVEHGTARLQSVSVLLWPKEWSESEMEQKVKLVNTASKLIVEHSAEVFMKETALEDLWDDFVENECIVRFRRVQEVEGGAKRYGCIAPEPSSHAPQYPEPTPVPTPVPTPEATPNPSATPNPAATPASTPTPTQEPEVREQCEKTTPIFWKWNDVNEAPETERAQFRACFENQKTRRDYRRRIEKIGNDSKEYPDLADNSTPILNQIIERATGPSASLKIDYERRQSTLVFNDLSKNPNLPAVVITLVDFNDAQKPLLDQDGKVVKVYCKLKNGRCRQTSDPKTENGQPNPNEPTAIHDVSLTNHGRRLKFTVPDLKSEFNSVTGKYLVEYQFDLARTGNAGAMSQKAKPTGEVVAAKDFAVFKGDALQVTNGAITHKGSGQIFGVFTSSSLK